MEKRLRVQMNDIFVPHLNDTARTQIFFGGSGSGKSWFLGQRLVLDLIRGGRNYLVCRQVARTIRSSVFQQVERVIREFGLSDMFKINQTEMKITCMNGYQVLFAGLDDVEKIKSVVPAVGVITDIWVEEATETERNDVMDLYKRQRGGDETIRKRMILSFNPILQSHWIYTTWFSGLAWADDQKIYRDDNLLILKTTYKDNRFLTSQDRHDLENETDKYRYNVYTLGNWGVLGHLVFTNWSVADLTSMYDTFTNRRHGLDFGFSADPAALWTAHYDAKHKTIYVYDEMLRTGMTNDMLAAELKERIGNDIIFCDSAEPKSIAELRKYGINARPSRKGRDSIAFGLRWLQSQKIIVDKKCVNVKHALSVAHWEEDAGGNALPHMAKEADDIIDAARYAHENDALQSRMQIARGTFWRPETLSPQAAELRPPEEVERMIMEYEKHI